jgi:hypothetical protein
LIFDQLVGFFGVITPVGILMLWLELTVVELLLWTCLESWGVAFWAVESATCAKQNAMEAHSTNIILLIFSMTVISPTV